jgi:hypothetical protein
MKLVLSVLSLTVALCAISPSMAEDAPEPLDVLRDRPDAQEAEAAAGGVALDKPYESLGLGISIRPPLGSKAVRHVGGDALEFVHPQNRWNLKVSRTELTQPMSLETVTDQDGTRHVGLLEVTVDRLKTTLPAAAVLRQDVTNVGPHDAGMVAIRYTQGLETLLTQQALVRVSDKLYFVIAMTSPGSKAPGQEPGDDPGERLAVETFGEVIDTAKLLDQRRLREEQDFRKYTTRALFGNLSEEKLRNALAPKLWFRIKRAGKDIGYVYTVEEVGEGIPGRRGAAVRRRGHARGRGAAAEMERGVLVGTRARTLPEENLRIESESWLFCTFDRRDEQWSNVRLVRDLKRKEEDQQMTLGTSTVQVSRALDRGAEQAGVRGEGDDPNQPPVSTWEQRTLNVTHVSRRSNAVPFSQGVGVTYLPQALAHLLPRLLPLDRPRQYVFSVYVEEVRQVMYRYVDVGEEQRVNFEGEALRAVPITDRIGLEGSPTVHYMTPNGKYVGSHNADTGIVVQPTSEQALLEIWKDAELTRPSDLKGEQPMPEVRKEPRRPAPAPGAREKANPADRRLPR